MKSLKNVLKTIIITGVIAILTAVPTFATEHQPNTVNATVIYSDSQTIEAEYNNKTYIVERDSETSNEQWNKGETIILDLNASDTHEALNGQYNGTIVQTYPEQNNLIVVKVNNDLYSFYTDDSSYKLNDTIELTFKNDEVVNASKLNNYNVEIQSISYLDNSITIQTANNSLYTFYVDDPRNYYLSEQINVTMNSNNQIVSHAVINELQIYYTTISQIENDTATLIINDNKYTFENIEGQDGWKIGDKCKAIIQDNRLLEVRPIPLAER